MTNPKVGQPEYLAPADKWNDLAKPGEAPTDDQKKAQDAVKEILLASLQMQNLVVLTGCGTSLSGGGPSMKDLWDAAIGKTPTSAASKVAGVIKYDLKTPNPNFEDFLSRCDAYLQVNGDEDVKDFVGNCKKVILDNCSTFLDVEKLDGHKTFLHRLSRRRVRDPRLKIFTTNYDLCFERAAGDLGLVVVDGFSFTQPRYYDPRFFGYDIVRRPRASEDQGSYLEGVFHLYKLHGSVNWARRQDGSIEEKQKPSSDEACLIYPARGKYQQSFLQPHLELVSQYFAALREPNTCLIVTGFGFNDDHLSEPVLSAVRSNPHLRLIIADYAAKDLINGNGNSSRYWNELYELSKQGEDIWFINASFPGFARLIPDLKSLTPADKLLKDIQKIAGGR
jgi:hypothetical protein